MEHNIIKIQSLIRGYLTRKKLQKLKDNIDSKIINLLLEKFIDYYYFIEKININLSKKKVRNINFPSEISENIVKYAIYKKYKIMPNWDTTKGDLKILNKNIEVKGFSSNGPSSFGPTENWDFIYFIDCKDFINKKFKVYEIKLSNKTKIWSNIKVNKNDTYLHQCDMKRRPHILFRDIQKQIKQYITLIFDGHIDELFI